MGAEERRKSERVTSKDIPRLLDSLECGDWTEQAETLTLLCPCRNVRYDKEVWVAIFRAAECSDLPGVKDRAGHAIGTLRERARTDPRSQALLAWLVERGVAPPAMRESIPAWRPFVAPEAGGLQIPPFPHPARSRHKRQRR
jgi:hypothetical protein